MRGARRPTMIPAVTTESTPETPSASAGSQAPNGASSERRTSTGGSLRRPRTNTIAQPATRPMTTPPALTTTKLSAAFPSEKAPLTAAITARRYATSEVASFMSDSLSRMITTRRGRPSRCAMAVAASASVGETMAPRAKATAHGTPDASVCTTTATMTVVASTSPTARSPIGRALAARSRGEVK